MALRTWKNPIDGFWDVPNNWVGDLLPLEGDDVLISFANDDITTEHRTGNTSLNEFTSDEAFVLSGGTLTVANTVSINNTFTLSGGTANFNGLSSSVNSLNFTNGFIGGEGNLTLNGPSTWSRGTMSGTGRTIVASGATLNMEGTTQKALNRTLDNQGTITYQGSDLRLGDIINNQGQFNSIGGGGFFGTSANSAFNNQGNFNRSGAGTTSFSRIAFNNSGTVTVTEGTLDLQGGGTHSGDFIGAGTLQLSSGTHTFITDSLLTNNVRITNSDSTTAAVIFNVDFNTGINTNLNFTNGFIGGGGNLTLNGPSTWSRGTMSGTGRTIVASGATLNMEGTTQKALNRTLDNQGTITYQGSDLRLGDIINNQGQFNSIGGGRWLCTNSRHDSPEWRYSYFQYCSRHTGRRSCGFWNLRQQY